MIITKNASNKRCSELNFQEKSRGAHMLSPSGVERGGPKICVGEIL